MGKDLQEIKQKYIFMYMCDKVKKTWALYNIDFDLLYRHKITVDDRTGRCTLLISKARPEDYGEYSCTASNPAGQDSTTASVLPGGMCRGLIKISLSLSLS